MNTNTKLTIADVEAMIQSVTYTRLPSGTAIVCEITLLNLHTVHGIAKVVDMENYDAIIGKQEAYKKALDPAFEICAYIMHNVISKKEVESKHVELTHIYQQATGHTSADI